MAKCANCGATLGPAWKFCLYCGTAMTAQAPLQAPAPVPPQALFQPQATQAQPTQVQPAQVPYLPWTPPPMPPDPDAAPQPVRPGRKQKSKLDVPLLIGIVLGGAGVVLIAYMAIVIFGPHA